ncbi:regakine-1-like [Labrus mixtus]|uniref:regakine-1-like n=1 Tax=Labrus mixtus TaxID=508554 RepID=UPI0029C0384F|nr:regakine-1-like [Labrus mixtus]
MRSSLQSVALLFFTTWSSLASATHGPLSHCCDRLFNTKIKLDKIMNYTIQSGGACPIEAVIFQTKSGRRLCSNPEDRWTKRAMLKVDRETKELLQQSQSEEGGSATIITPAVANTSNRARPEKGRNGRKRPGKKSKGRRRGQRKCV